MSGLAANFPGLHDTLRRLPLTLGWCLAAAALFAGGAGLAQHPRWALDAVLVGVALAAFATRPFPMLLALIVVGPKDSPIVEVLTLVAGGTVVLLRARPVPGWIVCAPWIALLALASYRLPIHPTAGEGSHPPFLKLPVFGEPYFAYPSAAMVGWWRLGSLLVVFAMTTWLVRDLARLRMVAAAIVVSAIVPVIIGFQQLATGKYQVRNGFRAIEGPFKYPNHFGFFLTGVLLVSVVLLFEIRSPRWRIAVGGLLAGCGACLVLTYTRGAWIGFCVGFLLIAIVAHRRLILVGAVALGLASFAFPGQVDKVQSRFSDLGRSGAAESKNSYNWRKGQWNVMYHRFGYDQPWSGHGFGTYPRLTVVAFGTEGHKYSTVAPAAAGQRPAQGFTAHNDYLRLLIELGVPGVLLWGCVLLALLACALSAARLAPVRPYALAAAGALIAIIVMSWADNLLGYTDALLVAFVLTGAALGAARGERSRAFASRSLAVPGSAG